MFKKLALGLAIVAAVGCGNSNDFQGVFTNSPSQGGVPADIAAVMNQSRYQDSIWGLRVVDSATGEVLINTQPDHEFFIASVRKCFSVGAFLEEVGPDHSYDTPVYTQGTVDGAGVLDGDLILVASGDLTVGGRRGPDGLIELTEFDHNEAAGLGNGVVPNADPLAGYKELAEQVAESGITRVTGEVAVDDRLFQHYPFRDEGWEISPAFVNDNVVDLIINPTTAGALADVQVRPLSSALTVVNSLMTSAAGTEMTLELDPELPAIGTPGATGTISGNLPLDFVPTLTETFPMVQTFRISKPTNFARTVFIEALEAEGVVIDAPTVETNPASVLPAANSYLTANRVALLEGSPASDLARYVMKVSYNIGADTSLLLYGLTQGVDNMAAALTAEQSFLSTQVGLNPENYRFIDGSGGGETSATTSTVTDLLNYMLETDVSEEFVASMPSLGIDGSLGFVKDFQSNPSLAGATGQVKAKTGTYVDLNEEGEPTILSQALGGYIDTKSGRRLSFMLVVNDSPFTGPDSVIPLFQDEGIISAILWRDF